MNWSHCYNDITVTLVFIIRGRWLKIDNYVIMRILFKNSNLYSDDGSTTKEVPAFLSMYGEEPFKSGTGTFHPSEKQADTASIKSDMVGNEDMSSQPLNPPDAYDKLPPRKVSNEDLASQPLHPPDTYDKLSPQKVSYTIYISSMHAKS